MAKIYNGYPELVLKHGIKWIQAAAQNYTIGLEHKPISLELFDSVWKVPQVSVLYPDSKLMLAKDPTGYEIELFGLRIRSRKSPLGLKELFSVSTVVRLL